MIRNSEDRYCKSEFDENDRLLSADFLEAGYHCGFVGKWHCGITRLPVDFGFDGMNVPGYGKCTLTDEYREYLAVNSLEQGEVVIDGGGWHGNIGLCGTLQGPEEASVPYFIAEETIRHLRERARVGKPFLLFANFWGPHAPYFPAEPYASMYDRAAIEPWGNFYEDFEGKPNAHRRYRDAFLGLDGTVRSWDECSLWAARYYGFSTMIDAQIGRILRALDDLGLSENTAVIFTTDHGDLLGAHGGMHDKASIMCQETYHIPFILRMPGAKGRKDIDRPITNMDLYATLLEVAGIDREPELDSRSVIPLIENRADTGHPETVMCEFNGHHYHYQSRMVTDGKHKYVFNAPEIDEFYDLENDPWETTNLIDDTKHADAVERMRGQLMSHCARSDDPLLGWIKNLYLPRKKTFSPYGEAYSARSKSAGIDR
jgi:arylsulfatase A-like enzyme